MDPLIQQLRQRISDPLRAADHALVETRPVPPPVSEQQLKRAEELLGLDLPHSLKSLYLQVGNGGFGPGYGLFPLPLGEPDFVDLVGSYWYVRGDERQPDPDRFFDATKLANVEPHADDEESSDDEDEPDFDWQWPVNLLPIISHGCGIYECIDCTRPEGAMILHHPDYLVPGGTVADTLTALAPSLERRFEAWLLGENLLQRAMTAYRKDSA